MNNKKLKPFFLVIFLCVVLSACEKPPAEQQIRENIASSQTGLEAKSLSDSLEFVAEDFIANKSMSKLELKRYIMGSFLRHKNINVKLGPIDIQMDGPYNDRAYMNTTAIVTGARGLIPDSGRIYKIKGEWQLRDGDWLVTKIDWEHN